MRIGELARAVGVDIETIRYYEKIRLLPRPSRGANGYRDYGEADLEVLAFIRHCRALDVPLADIKRLLELVRAQTAGSGVHQLIDEQLARVRARLKSMRALEKQLVALRSCCTAKHEIKACGILEELVSAARGEACVCHLGSQASFR